MSVKLRKERYRAAPSHSTKVSPIILITNKIMDRVASVERQLGGKAAIARLSFEPSPITMSYPEKPALTDLPIVGAIKRRWSPVAFSDKPLEPKMIAALFEAARWAPSSFGEEPWRYVYAAKGDDGREALESLLVEGNAWAKKAGLLAISFAKTNFTYNSKPNRHHLHDLGCATGYLVLQSTELGLVSHQMAGFAHEKANDVLGVPKEFVPGSMFAIGHYGDPKAMDEGSQKRDASPRGRKPVEEFAFKGRWKA